jgi:uncharacterized protein (DUF1501 family)
MPTTRRQFIKRSAGLVTVGMVMPNIWLKEALAQSPSGRKIFVVIQTSGGWDGLNILVPYADSVYHTSRPTIGFNDTELVADGKSTIIDNNVGLHPELSEIKALYDAGKVAIIQGVGYPTPNLSHFTSQDIYHTGRLNATGDGWLGRYADLSLVGKSGLSAVNIGGNLPRTLFADNFVTPSISNFNAYTFQTDGRFPGDRNNQLSTFQFTNGRDFPAGSYIAGVADTGFDAVAGAAQLQSSVASYRSTVTYPNQSLANALKMVAQVATTVAESSIFYVQLGGWDHHSTEIGSAQAPTDKTLGALAPLLRNFSEGINAFYSDMKEHGLADRTVILQVTEFGRRLRENSSRGCDHGTAWPCFVIGDPVVGGRLYGQYPSLTNLDSAGNIRFTVDFRSIYSTILDRWLQADSRAILGGPFENLGFLG